MRIRPAARTAPAEPAARTVPGRDGKENGEAAGRRASRRRRPRLRIALASRPSPPSAGPPRSSR
ncbi:hypothetical protein BJF79_00890 [Actinomadura sp. CNU-125]|uniref:hypothetical protein n=1 Tax=Actinomadura sp. CNU-125 TaxID=1904961 RepID=UPI000966C4B9|nr:hypothetical protein [Actinomadura sp. CNU-125]OLT31760.1 hypothetical protein BJF79_00890 [Actinomadura sp. CNU-125]